MDNFIKIRKSTDEIIESIVNNCFNMLKERKLIKDIDKKPYYEQLKSKFNFSIQLLNPDRDNIKVYEIHYFNQFNGMNTSVINETMKVKDGIHKIIIVDDVVFSNLKENNKFVELFKTSELMLNLIDFKYCPKAIMLNEEEIKQVLKDYNVSKKQLPQFEKKDPLVRYYNGRKGDMFKIIRSSPVSGVAIAYRVVV